MAQWSQDEFNRTIDEVKGRSLLDLEFRELALSRPSAAVKKINPKPLPLGLVIKFVEGPTGVGPTVTSGVLTIVLPESIEKADELSDAELEQAAGGRTDIQFPPQ